MAEVTSGENLTVLVLDEYEVEALRYLLDRVMLEGSDEDERALGYAFETLDALDVEVTV